MCGIAGVLVAEAGRVDVRPALVAMQRALRHRGPDDAGTWQSASGLAAFAHTRLAVIDLTAAGRQPMSTPDGRFTIVLNGEIYNHRDLRRELERRGATFRTRTDTEVVLRAFEADGEACLDRLCGMFALAVWDEREQACLLARDPFGIKPLYYHAREGVVAFASEVRALIESGLPRRDLDPDAVVGYFRTGSVPEPATLLRDIRCLEAGTCLTWSPRALKVRRYWSVTFPADVPPADAPVDVARIALAESVRRHLVADVPIGIFLSGGVDSTALLALARAAGGGELATFTLSLPGAADDEGPAARRTAAHFGATHHELPVDALRGRDLFGEFLRAADQPSIDGLNTYAVSTLAREHGFKVALSGLGADELFGGYRSFQMVPRLTALGRRLAWTGPAGRLAGAVADRAAPDARWRRLGDMMAGPATVASAYAAFRGIFTRRESRILGERYAGKTPSAVEGQDADETANDPTIGDTVSRLELTRYVRNQLLRDADAMSMAMGLELRTPFLDADLFAALASLPAATRLQPGKRLLVDAVPELPEWVRRAPKRCFQFPFSQWLAGEWRDVFASVDRDCPVPTGTWYRKWSVFVMDRWVGRLTRGGDA